MKCKCKLSMNTKTYMEQYHCILDTMVRQMTEVPLTDSISYSFIAQMIPHHKAAIAMSENLLQYTTNIPLQSIAQNIITSQKKSIENMKAVQNCCGSVVNTTQELARYQCQNECILSSMFQEMGDACTDNNIDGNFMREMIPHHKGAVNMSENALRFHLCPELVPLLNSIISSQKRGIMEMQRLLQMTH